MKKWLSLILVVIMTFALTAPVSAVAAKQITLNVGQITMTVGSTRQITVRWSPRGATEEGLTWRSSNDDVATVDSTGVITAVKRGEAVISARSDRGLKASVRVTVRDEGQKISAQGLEMLVDSMLMRVDQTRLLTAYYTPTDTTDKDIVWSSSDTNVATVDPDGEVTGIAPGTAIITASGSNDRSATCTVTVSGTLVGATTKDATVSQAQNSSVFLTSAAARTAVEEVAAATKKNAVGTAVFKNKNKVSATVLGAAAYSAREAGKDIRLRFRTETEAGKLQGHLTFDPQVAKDTTKQVGVAVHSDSKRATAAQERFEKDYSNTLAAFELNHSGSFGFSVDVVVKPAVSGLKTTGLHFYSYNPSTGKHQELAVENARMDKNGYLHFTTTQGGVIIASNGALTA